jgi:hypothetical protein
MQQWLGSASILAGYGSGYSRVLAGAAATLGPRDPEISSRLWTCSSLSTSEGLNHGDEAADLSAVQDDTPDVEEDDLLNEELDRVNDFLGNLSIVDD